jgi:hypothetical protein
MTNKKLYTLAKYFSSVFTPFDWAYHTVLSVFFYSTIGKSGRARLQPPDEF